MIETSYLFAAPAEDRRKDEHPPRRCEHNGGPTNNGGKTSSRGKHNDGITTTRAPKYLLAGIKQLFNFRVVFLAAACETPLELTVSCGGVC